MGGTAELAHLRSLFGVQALAVALPVQLHVLILRLQRKQHREDGCDPQQLQPLTILSFRWSAARLSLERIKEPVPGKPSIK